MNITRVLKVVVGLVLVAALAAGGLFLWHNSSAAAGRTSFRTAAVERGDLVATISATGTIEPEEVIDIGAQVVGQIKGFGRDPRDGSKVIDYGTPVEEGTVLLTLDDSLYRSQLESAVANKQKAVADLGQLKARLVQAERDWHRMDQLSQTRAVSDLDADTAKANYESCKAALAVGEAAVNQTEAARKQAEINLGYTTIRSPVKGVIVDRRVNVGQTVVSSLNAPSLFLIAKDLKRLQVWASVNEADIGQIYIGQPVTFTVDARAGEVFKGEVIQIRLNASMTQNVVTYTVVVNADNSDGRLLDAQSLKTSDKPADKAAAGKKAPAPKEQGGVPADKRLPYGKLLPYLTANLQFEMKRQENVLLVPNAALRWLPQPDQVVPDARDAFVQSQRKKDEKPGNGGNGAPAGGDKPHGHRGVVWVEEGNFVRPIPVQTGLSDGLRTEVSGEGVTEGLAVVVGGARTSGGNDTVNPFATNMFGGGKKN
jgi:HlyD family secretion protein